MAQVSWLYLDDNGGKHRVGLYHGDHSGHLVIYCNLKVVQIDFSVLASKTYSFFIEEDLIEISLQKEKTGFSYGFEVNRQADTPKNRARRIVNRRNAWQIALFFTGCLAVVIGGFFALRAYNRRSWDQKAALQSQKLDGMLSPETQKKLLASGKTTTAKIYFLKQENGKQRTAMYAFQTLDNQRIQGKITVPDTGQILLPTGFELSDKDEFELIYLPEKPETHQIRYDLPTDLTRHYYLRAAVREEQLAHPDDGPQRSTCKVFTAQNERGWQVLADFIFQNTPPERNPRNNRDSYLRLVRDPSLSEKLKKTCWDQ